LFKSKTQTQPLSLEQTALQLEQALDNQREIKALCTKWREAMSSAQSVEDRVEVRLAFTKADELDDLIAGRVHDARKAYARAGGRTAFSTGDDW
jgi:hypothetical protein